MSGTPVLRHLFLLFPFPECQTKKNVKQNSSAVSYCQRGIAVSQSKFCEVKEKYGGTKFTVLFYPDFYKSCCTILDTDN